MPDGNGNEPSIWTCGICQQTFGSAAELAAHQATHD